MKIKRLYSIIIASAAAVLLWTACDKISPDEYIVYAGATGEWVDGNGVSDKTQRAFMEKYTGVRCFNCPVADTAINNALAQYGGRLIAVAVHDSSTLSIPYSGQHDMRTADGDAWSVRLGVRAAAQYPTGLVCRTINGSNFDRFTPSSGIEDRVNAVLAQSTEVAVAVEAAKGGSNITIDVDVEYLQQVDQELTLTLFIMEDGIRATQLLPDMHTKDSNYIHNHVLRDVITDIWGVDIDANGAGGTKRKAQFTYTPANATWNLDQCHIVALVSDKATLRVLNVAECEVK